MQPMRIGSRLGRYQVLELLGVGGMSEVYAGVHLGLRKRVAIKVLRAAMRDDAGAVERFLREGECAARVCHPNVVDVDDVGLEQGIPYLVMELLHGETLAARIERTGALALREAVDLLLPLIDAVASIHAAGVIHRDIKPGNIVLTSTADGGSIAKLVDFGVATVLERRAITGAVGPIGTPQYMSPEQAMGARVLDPASDQYSLAGVLFEMLTGRAPFQQDHVRRLLRTVAQGDFPAPSSSQGALPAEFCTMLARATARDPGARFESVHEFGRALMPFASAPARDAYVRRMVASSLRRPTPEPGEAAHRAWSAANPERHRHRWKVPTCIVAGVAMCLGVVLGTGHTKSEDLSPDILRAAAVAHAPHAAIAPEPLRVWPSDAQIELDGRTVTQGSFEHTLAADDTLHALRVSAPAHVPRLVFFRGALALAEVTLAPLR